VPRCGRLVLLCRRVSYTNNGKKCFHKCLDAVRLFCFANGLHTKTCTKSVSMRYASCCFADGCRTQMKSKSVSIRTACFCFADGCGTQKNAKSVSIRFSSFCFAHGCDTCLDTVLLFCLCRRMA
jgi:hypothetical protein